MCSRSSAKSKGWRKGLQMLQSLGSLFHEASSLALSLKIIIFSTACWDCFRTSVESLTPGMLSWKLRVWSNLELLFCRRITCQFNFCTFCHWGLSSKKGSSLQPEQLLVLIWACENLVQVSSFGSKAMKVIPLGSWSTARELLLQLEREAWWKLPVSVLPGNFRQVEMNVVVCNAALAAGARL